MADPTRPAILITHPGRQHSHQAALALSGAGMLAGYWSGVPAVAEQARFIPRRAWSRYEPLSLPPSRARCAPWTPALRRLGGHLPSRVARRLDFLACRLFDHWAAALLSQAGATAVIACEISALTTFRRARQLDIVTILDAPSLHHLEQDRVQSTLDSPALHRRIAAVKDAEIAAADLVITVSALARDSYVERGAAPERVLAVTLGADRELFGAPDVEPPEETFTFVFAGAAIYRKGFDLLVDAFAATHALHPTTRLRVIGPAGEALKLAQGRPGIEIVGALDQRRLAHELARAHVLVLPSRHDSFGMVVVEALAAGTPTLVSEMVGAKDLVSSGESGWIVPMGDAAALAERMSWCASHPVEVLAMRPRCRGDAARASWAAYHRRLVDALSARLNSSGHVAGLSARPAVMPA